ncbi:ATP-binding protein [Oceanihabitans sediminis]|uniref:ATP-binding response regulator n=1 Tax=Oceanihabitans sediminis TaxID=1812012 RepID=UPI00299E749F|nr:ATP-binding protein [Oceanihabitans sediminis]MDX1277480.1 ATP-binding protein [Oceanihabitans sediminis]MDX1772821.1 ATP-binding protein [Oceanihabitans sediminis]
MLQELKKSHKKDFTQYILLDNKGNIIDSDGVFYSQIINKNISSLHPFFESFSYSLSIPKKELIFSCIHLNTDKGNIISDILIKTLDDDNALIIIQDLSTHYKNYQLTAQKRNESVINSQILELKNKYLKEKEEFKNSFIANFSHDIREPLSGISTFVEILNKTNLNAEQKGYVNLIYASSNHLKHMIEDILDIAKKEVGKLNLVEESFNLKVFIESLVLSHQVKAKQKSLDFELELDSKTPEFILGDPYRLKQILDNLLDNALKFTHKGEIKLHVSLNQIRANKASIHFKVSDTGIGIEEENFEKIFDSFTQLHQEHHIQGNGLGLAIAKSLIELQEGTISVTSIKDKGTTFSTNLSFKVDNSNPQKVETNSTIEIKGKKEKYHILLVEHSEITQLAVLKILAAKRKFYLDIVSDPEDVIPILENQNVDVILMDINLPKLSGDELAKQIRQLSDKTLKKTPIIALTGKVFPEDLKRYKKAKINEVVSKPFDEASLLNAINKHLK